MLNIQSVLFILVLLAKGGTMKSFAVSSIQQNQPNFKSRLICDEGAKKIIEKELSELAYQYRINHSSKPAPVFADLQQRFEQMTQGRGGVFELLSAQTHLNPKAGYLDVVFKNTQGNIIEPDSKALLSSYEVMPNELFDGNEPFKRAVKTIINKVFNPNKPHKSTDIVSQNLVDSFSRMAS